MAAAQHLVRLGPSAVELVDRTMIDLARSNPAFRPVIDAALIGEPEAILLVEFTSGQRDEALARLRELSELMGDLGLPGSVVEMTDTAPQKALWEVRKAGLNIMMSMKGDGKPVSFIEDCAVPLEHLADYVDRLTAVFAKHGTRGTWYAHASVGTLHVRPILDMRRDGAAKMRAIAEEAGAMVREYKGAFSGEHGDGLVRSEWVAWQFGPRITRAFEEIKDLFDPGGLMNPGKIVRATRMDERTLFRYKPGHRTLPLATALDWSSWNVHADPVADTLTPPGTGDDPAQRVRQGRGDVQQQRPLPQVRRRHDVPELSRHARRAAPHARPGEHVAPRGVGAARGRVRVGGGARRARPVRELQGVPARVPDRRRHGEDEDRVPAPVAAEASRCRSRTASSRTCPAGRRGPRACRGLRTCAIRSPAQRACPNDGWGSRRNAASRASAATPSCARRPGAMPRPRAANVVLLVDTFTNYYEPENAHAALAVLRAAGYDVAIAQALDADAERTRPLCCGRTFLAAGLVDEARHEARRMLDALVPHVARGAAIVGLEPSCLYSLRDEFLSMRLGDAAARVAPRAFLFEEFLAAERRAGKLKLHLQALPHQRALLHGHCHQKAFDAMGATREVLGLVPDLAVDVVETSCCGMAGSFGYEARHYDVSMRMAELALLPAVRAADPATLLVADGTSCRHQIADGARREARHVARVLADALAH